MITSTALDEMPSCWASAEDAVILGGQAARQLRLLTVAGITRLFLLACWLLSSLGKDWRALDDR
jgi:hypothetical protein